MNKETVYRCNLTCPIQKRCFIIKTLKRLDKPIIVLQKCIAKKKDVEIIIGELIPP